MEQYQADIVSYFDERILDCQKRKSLLEADERNDEADFEKIRENIYQIFKTIFSVSLQAGGSDSNAVRKQFLEKLDQIPESWRESLRKAQEHGDTAKIVIEQLKLTTAEEIKTASLAVWKEETL